MARTTLTTFQPPSTHPDDAMCRDIASLQPLWFAQHYLKDYIRGWSPPPEVHQEWIDLALGHKRLAIHAPRDHAKSSVFSLIYVLWRICEERRRMIELGWPAVPLQHRGEFLRLEHERIALFSKSGDSADDLVQDVAFQLEFNEELIKDYGTFRGRQDWSPAQGSISIIDKGSGRGPTLKAIGRGKQVAGMRLTMAVLDDIEDYESTRIDTRRKGTQEWFFRDVVNAVLPTGQIILIGTAQHEDDLIHTIKGMGFYDYKHYAAEDTQGAALWPERYDINVAECLLPPAGKPQPSRLDAIKLCKQCRVYTDQSLGKACLKARHLELGELVYQCQFMNNIKALEGGVFKREWFKYYNPSQIRQSGDNHWYWHGEKGECEEHLDIYIGIDPAIGEKTQNDFFCAIVIGVTKAQDIFVLYMVHDKLDFPTQVQQIIQLSNAWLPKAVGVETNAYQKALKQQVMREAMVPVRELHHGGDKLMRIISTSSYVESGKVRVHPAMQGTFVEAMAGFPNSSHDDIPDAFEDAFDTARLRAARAWVQTLEEGGRGRKRQRVSRRPEDPRLKGELAQRERERQALLDEARRKGLKQ